MNAENADGRVLFAFFAFICGANINQPLRGKSIQVD